MDARQDIIEADLRYMLDLFEETMGLVFRSSFVVFFLFLINYIYVIIFPFFYAYVSVMLGICLSACLCLFTPSYIFWGINYFI